MFKFVDGKLATTIGLTLLLCFTLMPYGKVDGTDPNIAYIKGTSNGISSLSKKQRNIVRNMRLPYNSYNTKNLTFLNMTVNITLKNGSKLMFSSPSEAISNITSEITNESRSLIPNITFIQNTSCFLYHDILGKLEKNETRINETIGDNITLSQNKSIPGYKLFFSNMRKWHQNYTSSYGSLIPVNAKEYLEGTYGEQYTKTFLYGSIPLPNVTSIDNDAIPDNYFTGKENLLIYLNSSNKALSRNTLQTAKKVKNATDANIIAIDINENATYLRNLQEDLNITFPIALDSNTSLPGLCVNNTSSVFGISGETPLLIFLHVPEGNSKGLIWRKSIGWENTEKTIAYIEAFTKGIENKVGINVYPVWGISTENVEPDKDADIFVNLGEGNGEISTKEMKYTFFDKNGKVIGTRNQTREMIKSGSTLKRSIDVPEKKKSPKKLTVIVHVKSHGTSLWKRNSFEIELEKEEETPWGVYAGITIAIILLIIGVLLNRKMKGEKTKS